MEQLLTVLLALYGAILSSLLAVHEWRKGRPCVRLTVSQGFLNNSHGNSEPVIQLHAVNVGAGKVHLAEVGFLLSDKKRGSLWMPYLPLTLEERSSHTVSYACRYFRENFLDKDVVGAYFRDQTDHFWRTKVTPQERQRWIDAPSEGWHVE